MKVTIYTINDCKFSQAEKDYLKTNGIAFEEKNVEQNRDFLTEMLGISENFAGTPVTKIEKDDGMTNVLKGFTQEEFDKELGIITAPDVLPPTPPMPSEEMSVPAPTPEPAPLDVEPISLSDNSTIPAVDTQTTPISLSDIPEKPNTIDTSSTPPAIVNVEQAAPADQLNSVLENLQNQVNTPVAPASPNASQGGPPPKI